MYLKSTKSQNTLAINTWHKTITASNVVRIISMNKRIIHKKCGGFDVCFYAFNQFSGLYFHSSKDTPRSQRSVQLVARIKGVNKLIFFEKCGGFGERFYAFNEFGELYFLVY